MCGIVGILNAGGQPVLLEELHWMSRAIAHRGPDDDGYYLNKGVGLGMRRLSIIDLTTGRQPISNEDGTVWAVFNGEIYNYRELRTQLEQNGHWFSTTTDTETIVHLYEDRGPECVQELRGMFSFAIWDERKQELLIARDRLGIKPLYYTEINRQFVFASEMKAILQLPGFQRNIDWGALNHLFTFLSTAESDSILEGIHKLKPGHLLIASPNGKTRIRQYWDVQFEPDVTLTEESCKEQLLELLDDSVRSHLVSDVPVGAFLSGGIDSSAVVARMVQTTSARVQTFSIGFSEGPFDELQFAQMIATRFDTDHHELVLEPNALDILEDLIWYLDEPFGDSSAIPTFMVSKMASERVKVVLSGDGGDELFAGYDKYAVEGRERRYGLLPSVARKVLGAAARALPGGIPGRRFLRHMSLSGTDRYLDAFTLFPMEEKRKLFRNEAFEILSLHDPRQSKLHCLDRQDGHWLSALQYLDLKSYLPLDILTKVDRMSMAHSLEVRVPLLDHKLVEFAARIPPQLVFQGGVRKYIFKRAMAELLPSEVIDKPKQGFAVPLGSWFRGGLENVVREVLLSETMRRRGIFSPEYIEHLLKLHKLGRDLDLHLWTLLSFEMWCRTFLDRRVKATGDYKASPLQVANRPVDPVAARELA